MTIEKIILHYESKKENLLPAIKEINSRLGFVSSEAIGLLAKHFRLKKAEIFSTASFYDDIRVKFSNKIIIQVCDSAPCQIRGADKVLSAIENFFHQKAGDDFNSNIKIERISCLGHCAEGPNVLINGTLYSRVNEGKIIDIISGYIND
ncbi:MAG: NAD(P)H-dependent oxidoreductase subunit E [Candidatus Moranbacteria bacterium]|jgi:NADH:ubiquinone oxidoreductase subunit E|nr:NAD(P)H-dependent oxidoreductase subunit E [Candidatus Moranbacteria bacterium]